MQVIVVLHLVVFDISHGNCNEFYLMYLIFYFFLTCYKLDTRLQTIIYLIFYV